MHRPRNVDWKRAAALLYGDWGTSKAYVIGFAFSGVAAAAAWHALPIIIAVCALTALVAWNYVVVCKNFPDGGGVYSAAREQSRMLAVVGALLLVADLTVTAAMSGWSAMSYFRVPDELVKTITVGIIVVVGAFNFFGPKHSGSLAVTLALPMVAVVVIIGLLSLPHLTTKNLEPMPSGDYRHLWLCFVNMVLALSGVEAIANLTGVMKLDPGATMDKPSVAHTARKSILPVGAEVVFGTVLLGWAMLSLPKTPEMEATMHKHWESMLNVLAEQFGTMTVGPAFGHYFGIVTGIVVGLLLLSAVNTAIAALIGLVYMLGRDGEMPRAFTRLNKHGVPWLPLFLAVILPVLVVLVSNNLNDLMDLYAIGVVGAIAVNLGSCTFNRKLRISVFERSIMAFTFLTLFAVEFTLARTKPNALFFVVCVLGIGFGLRGWAQRRAGLRTITVSEQVAATVAPDTAPEFQLNLESTGHILVAARGLTPVVKFALEEARLRKANLYVLYVKELAVALPGPLQSAERPRWQDDPAAARVLSGVIELARQHEVTVVPVYAVSDNPSASIVDLAATLGIDMLILGCPHRSRLVALLKGDIATEVAKSLPENIQLIIHG